MTGNQQKKRVNASSLVGCTSHERCTVKKKKNKVEISEPDLDMIHNPVISLELDTEKKIVVSKRNQIGISQRHLIPFAEPASHSLDILADVVSVPGEIFELHNLSEVLSYEAWQSLLTKNERKRLSQFLPKETELDTLVQDLLSGDNFNFGNPFLSWSASLCLGELHPDNVLHEEQSLKERKNVYHSFLQEYHNDMIGTLQYWKEKWDFCEDPEVDIAQITRRSRKNMTPEWQDSEGNPDATPDSCSDSEKAPSSDNQDSRIVERRKDCLNIGVNSYSRKNVAAAPRRVEKLHKYSIQHGDGTRYMSYVKVSKQQHERVKCSMKHSNNNMQPRTLNHVLGIIDSLNVQPFERFEEEEKKKLQDCWLKLATQYISEGFAYWRKRQLLRKQLIQSLGKEARQKFDHESTRDEEKNGSRHSLIEHSNDNNDETMPAITREVTEQSGDSLLEQSDGKDNTCNIETQQENRDARNRKNEVLYRKQAHVDKIDHTCLPDHIFVRDHHRQPVTLTDRRPVVSITDQQRIGKVDVNIPIKASHGFGLQCDVHSYYQPVASSTGYGSSQESTLGYSQFIQEQPLIKVNRTTNRLDKDSGKDMFVGQSEHTPLFNSYPNQDRNELLQSVFKVQSAVPYHNEPKHPSLDFQPASNTVAEARQYQGHLTEPVHPSIHQALHESIYSDRVRYTMPRHGHLAGNIHDWTRENSIRSAVSSRADLNCGEFNQNWYASDNGHQDVWPAFENAGFVGSSERFIHARNYRELNEGTPSSSVPVQPTNSFSYMNGFEDGGSVKLNNTGWVGIPTKFWN